MTLTSAQIERGVRLRALDVSLQGKPVEWGIDDCSLMAAQWVADETGLDVFWPDYHSKEEAETIIREYGGLVSVWDSLAASIGITPRYNGPPEIGDVGIIETSLGLVGGIWLHGSSFLWRSENGVRILGVRARRIVKVWRVPHAA